MFNSQKDSMTSFVHEYEYEEDKLAKVYESLREFDAKTSKLTIKSVKTHDVAEIQKERAKKRFLKNTFNGQAFLKKRVKAKSSVSEIVDAFEEMCEHPVEDDLLAFSCRKNNPNDGEYTMTLMRQYPNGDGEYYQLCVDELFVYDGDETLDEDIYNEDIEQGFFAYIRESKAYKAANTSTKHRARIILEET